MRKKIIFVSVISFLVVINILSYRQVQQNNADCKLVETKEFHDRWGIPEKITFPVNNNAEESSYKQSILAMESAIMLINHRGNRD